MMEKKYTDLDEKVIKLIKENYPIRWAKGAISGIYLDKGKYLKIHVGEDQVNWSIPTTKISITTKDGIELLHKVVGEGSEGVTVEVINYSPALHGNIIEWALVDECSHKWKEGIHTMSLKVMVI